MAEHPFSAGKPKLVGGHCSLCGEETEKPSVTVCGLCMEMLEQEEWNDSMGMDVEA
jgi:hypothetical protein